MKLKFKHIFFCSLIGMSGLGVTSCDDFWIASRLHQLHRMHTFRQLITLPIM